MVGRKYTFLFLCKVFWCRMPRVWYSTGIDTFAYLNESAKVVLRELRRFFSNFKIEDTSIERPFLVADKNQTLYSFTGTSINRTIGLLLDLANIKHRMNNSDSSFEFDLPKQEVFLKWDALVTPLFDIEPYIKEFYEQNPKALHVSKWSRFLSINFQAKLFKQRHLDISGTSEFMSNIKFVENIENVKDDIES